MRARHTRGHPLAATLSCGLLLAASAPVIASGAVRSTGGSETRAVDARLRTVLYSADEVYSLPGRVGYEIDVQFETGERFTGVGVGDAAGLAFMAADNHLFIKPRAVDVHTDLTVLTTRRIYHFEYQTEASDAGGPLDDVVYALRFSYPPAAVTRTPEGAANGAARPASIQSELAHADAVRHHNTDYWYCGPRQLQPLSAWDDGVQTHLHFAANAELPAVFVSEPDGSESLVNFHVAQDEIVVHRIAHRFVLRRGALVGCVVNRGFAGSGVTLPSGTVSPRVERAVRGSSHVDGR